MTVSELKSSVTPPEDPLAASLFWIRNGEWAKAHDIVESMHSRDAAWIHGYLHRIEGDKWNATYWYNRAGKSFPSESIKEEWEVIAKSLFD